MGWDVSEVDGLAKDLATAGPKAEALAKTVVAKTGFDTVAGAQSNAPVDTGALKNSIGVDMDDDGLGFEAGPTVSYAPYVHWGTSRMGPRPFLTTAFDKAVAPLDEVFEQVGKKALE